MLSGYSGVGLRGEGFFAPLSMAHGNALSLAQRDDWANGSGVPIRHSVLALEVFMVAKRGVILLAMCLLTGCEMFNGSSVGPLVPDARSPVADVPMPAGFSMGDDSSSQQ